MAENTEPLLGKQDYHDNCEACEIEKLKDTKSGIPFKLLFFVWIVTLAAALPISSLFPFLYFMIRDFDIAKREEDISYYAGYVGSSFMVGRALTSLLWGIVADKYGRRPVIMIGTMTLVIFNTLFGLSVNYWMAILTRFLLGSLCGILGPMRAYVSEICRKEHQALGMSVISTSWGIGLVIGPAVGGFLAQCCKLRSCSQGEWRWTTGEGRSSANDNRKASSPSKKEDRSTKRGASGVCNESSKLSGKEDNQKFVWPRLLISLSNKEKEEDFMIMKGCKPSQRPKKRAKGAQRAILAASLGAWLSDVCRERYEVREKKTNKKNLS